MIAVQTLNCHSLYQKNDVDALQLQLIMALVSSYLLKKQYDNVVLYCDSKTAEILKDSFYSEIRILPKNIFGKYNYGTLAKLYTYSNVEEEYIHFDIDYFLFKKIELKNDILCAYSETKKKLTESVYNKTYINLIDKLKTNYNQFKFPFNVVDENYATNTCIFGVPTNYYKDVTEYFKELNEYTENHIETIFSTYTTDEPPHWAIEQYMPAQFFLENNFKITELNPYENYQIRRHIDSIRLYEMENFSLVGTARLKDINLKEVITKYMKEHTGHHLWITKGVDGIDDILKNVIKELYPEVYNKIINTLNRHFVEFNKNKKTNKFI